MNIYHKQKKYIQNHPVSTDIFSEIKAKNNLKNSNHIIIIPNVCSKNMNLSCRFSRELYKIFPIAEADASVNFTNKLGTVSFIESQINPASKSKIIVANMLCQSDNTKNSRSIHYGALVKCMYSIKYYAEDLYKNYPDFKVEIHSAKIGVGVQGANWNFINDLMLDIWPEIKIQIYQQDNTIQC